MNTFSTRVLLLILAGLLLSGRVLAQICETDTTLQTTPTVNFVSDNPDPVRFPVTLAEDGSELLDLNTGLVWQRCSLGQSWQQETQRCLGVPVKLSWQLALVTAQDMASADKAWRIPNIKELASIIDFQCQAPPFNLEVFPDTPASVPSEDGIFGSGYWTSSPFVSDSDYNKRDFRYAWYFDAHIGEMRWKPVTSGAPGVANYKNFIRLVRSPNP